MFEVSLDLIGNGLQLDLGKWVGVALLLYCF